MSPKVSIIILNWNGLKDTLECLESLKKITYPNYEVVVVDNGSEGIDAQEIQTKYPDYVHLIKNDKNYGFAEGNNIALRCLLENSRPDFFLLLNNDTTVDPEFLTNLVAVATQSESIGIVGPKIYFYGEPDIIQSFGAKINFGRGTTSDFGWKHKDIGQFERDLEVDYVSGCAFLLKSQLIDRIGFLDSTYFCYFEETDFCVRARKAGFKILATPRSKIWHKKKLIKKWGGLSSEEKGSAGSFYYMGRNVFVFMKKHATQRQYNSFIAYYFLYQVWYISAMCLFYHLSIKQFISFWRGVRKGFGLTVST